MDSAQSYSVCSTFSSRLTGTEEDACPVLPRRCRILPGKVTVRGLPGAERRDAEAAGRSALDGELSRRQDARLGGCPAAFHTPRMHRLRPESPRAEALSTKQPGRLPTDQETRIVRRTAMSRCVTSSPQAVDGSPPFPKVSVKHHLARKRPASPGTRQEERRFVVSCPLRKRL